MQMLLVFSKNGGNICHLWPTASLKGRKRGTKPEEPVACFSQKKGRRDEDMDEAGNALPFTDTAL